MMSGWLIAVLLAGMVVLLLVLLAGLGWAARRADEESARMEEDLTEHGDRRLS